MLSINIVVREKLEKILIERQSVEYDNVPLISPVERAE